MPKPKIVKAAATRKLVRNPKPRGPSRVVDATERTGKVCEAADCGRPAVVFHRWKWWCKRDDPGDKPDPACTHGLRSVVFGVMMCSYCGGSLGEAS